jgi:hypothetical protein
MSYVLSEITQTIPRELLELAFKPEKFQTTLEQRIISQIIEGPILLNTNLVGGKRREIYLSSRWLMDMEPEGGWSSLGTGTQGAYYRVPPEAREGRNLSSVIGITSSLSGSSYGTGYTSNGSGGFGNTLNSAMAEMVNSRTLAQYPIQPRATLEGTNVICLFPRFLVEDVAVTVMLEYDSEFINLERSAIMALIDLCVCATQRYIANELRVSVDETEIVAGMEIGVIKTLIDDYAQKGELFREKLIRFKGASHADKRSINRLIFHAL